MSFGDRLTHTVTIVRQVATGAQGDYGHATTADSVLATVKAAIQPRRERELAATDQGGVATSEYVLFLLPTDITTADAIVHDPDTCPVSADLPAARFEIIGTPNAAGLGHHLEVQARLNGAPQEADGS